MRTPITTDHNSIVGSLIHHKIHLVSATGYYLSCPICATETVTEDKIASEHPNMAASMGAFAAFKVRDQMNDDKNGFFTTAPNADGGNAALKDFNIRPPTKYNEKLMMSIWGLYNRYSVHNMKSHKSLDEA